MAFDFATLNRAGGSLYKPRILGYSRDIIGTELGNRAAERDAFSEQGQRARLAELSQQDMANEQMQREREAFELAKRQKEKEEYAKWEKEQILNQVASQLYSDKKANGDYGAMLSPSQQLAMAAKEAARRGQGGYAQEFMAQAQGLAAKEQQAAQAAEQTRLENEKLKAEAELARRKAEAGYRESSDVIDSTDSAGNVRLISKRTGEVLKEIPGAGKPSATFEKTQAAQKKMAGDLDSAIADLEEVTKEGGLLETSTGSGLGALVDTGVGFFGGSTEGAIAASRLGPIYDKALKMVPRFEGPQSDKDTAAYNRAAGDFANPAMPKDRKLGAAKELLRIMKERRGQFVGSDIQGTEADQLPPSMGYVETRVLPDGRKIGKKSDGSLELIK